MPKVELAWSLVEEGRGITEARNSERPDELLNSPTSKDDMQPFQCIKGFWMVQRNAWLTCDVQHPMWKFGSKGKVSHSPTGQPWSCRHDVWHLLVFSCSPELLGDSVSKHYEGWLGSWGWNPQLHFGTSPRYILGQTTEACCRLPWKVLTLY